MDFLITFVLFEDKLNTCLILNYFIDGVGKQHHLVESFVTATSENQLVADRWVKPYQIQLDILMM